MMPTNGDSPNVRRVLDGFLPDHGRGPRLRVNVPLASTVFLAVLAVLVLLRPDGEPGPTLTPMQQLREVSEPSGPQELPETVVTRSENSLLAPLSEQATQIGPAVLDGTESISDVLRQPIRLLNTQEFPLSLRDLVHDTLAAFDHPVTEDDALFLLLVQLLAERQSNTYIEATLQQAYTRGEIRVPDVLTNGKGGVDTEVLLGGLIYMSSGDHGLPMPAASARRFGSEDSLSAMALD